MFLFAEIVKPLPSGGARLRAPASCAMLPLGKVGGDIMPGLGWKALTVGLALFVGISGASAQNYRDQAKALCASRYPDSYSLQKLCYDNEMDGMRFVADQAEQSAEYGKMAAHCMTRYKKGDGYQWSLAKLCFENEIDAYKALNP
ncbi:hypothetical protein X773_01130 [Mesorhizobium sp. LSJC285A00]|uniref:hypothetical protein n=1 Tax=unclassified Mesorhizobium TaxID=325217 RepID=UPI0003CE2459|nr:hypothetical protein [Mesorhizobium sp. LSJC285A00]ESW91709.1 hypothetical protein X773_01130 [Mesorhizobium sp. LSJC285A00]